MTKRSDFKDITIKKHSQEAGFYVVNIVHREILLLDTVNIGIYSYSSFNNIVQISYSKPYTEKYIGLVVEWLVNNVTQNISKITYGQRGWR